MSRAKGTSRERPLGRGEGRLRPPFAVDETEVPVVDVDAAPMPLVRPGEDERARAARRVRCAQLPLEQPRLDVDSVAAAVEADLGDQQRPLAGDVVEARQVRLERSVGLEVDVEADKVEEGQLQVLGGRVVDVGDERSRVDAASPPSRAAR